MASLDMTTVFFVTEVLKTAGKLEKEDISLKTSKLTSKIHELKLEVEDVLTKKFVEFKPCLQATLTLSDRVRSLEDEMESLCNKIENEIKGELNTSTSEFNDLSYQLHECNGILLILNKLSDIQENLASSNRAIQANSYTKAAKCLDTVHKLLSSLTFERENEIKIFGALNTEHCVLSQKLLYSLGEIWDKTIVWHKKKNTTTLEITGLDTENGRKEFGELTEALSYMNEIEVKVKQLSSHLTQEAINPVIFDQRTQVTVSKDGTKKSLKIITFEGDAEIPNPTNVFFDLGTILQFVQKHLNSKSLMRMIGDILSADMLDLVIKDVLSHSIPTNHKELDSYNQVVKITNKFHSSLVAMYIIPDTNTQLVDYMRNINVLFANKKCQKILERARNLMTSDIHNMRLIGDGQSYVKTEDEANDRRPSVDGDGHPRACLSDNTFQLPSCYISESVQQLMDLAHETLDEAVVSSPQCAIQLFYCVRNMFELFCSVVPTYHKQSLETLPQLSAVHHNNCMYLSHNLLLLGHQYHSKLPAELGQEGAASRATFVDLVQKLRTLGVDCFLHQMTLQKAQIIDFLVAAEGFNNMSDEDNFHSAERALKQVMHTLNHLSRIWREVLPLNIYYKSIGTLLNTAVTECINSVCRLEDISQEDGNQLHQLLTILTEHAPHLFDASRSEGREVSSLVKTDRSKWNNTSSLAELNRNVAKWSKFNELLIILNAGLQEINDRWTSGKGPLALEFTPNEVKQLIRALFQNTERRATVLSKIK